MTTTHTTKRVAEWLAVNFAPHGAAEIAVWSERVRNELGQGALADLVELLAHGDLEQQYQAMAAARMLGAEVWADGKEPDMRWLVKLPNDPHERVIRPEQQLVE